MATQPIAERLISVEEYLNSIYHPDREFNDGILEERNLGEFDHSWLQGFLGTFFNNHIDDWGVFAIPEQRVQLNPRRYLIPDLAVLRMGTPRERVLSRPPLITIEIMSPKDTLREAAQKSTEYQAFGVEHVWVIDPVKRRTYRGAASALELVPSGILTVKGTPVVVSVPDFFEKLDRF